MSMFQIVMRLGRSPGYPDGDLGRGYKLIAPLDDNGRLDVNEWRVAGDRCKVTRFAPGRDRSADGYLSRRGSNWYFHYDDVDKGDDEPVCGLGEHRLLLGDYVTIREADGQDLTYRITQQMPLATIRAMNQEKLQ